MKKHRKSAICGLIVVSSIAVAAWAAPPQKPTPDSEQRQTVEQAFATFAGCVTHKDIKCIAEMTSDHGMTLGVDGPLIAKRQLATDESTQCFFWGENCQRPQSKACDLSSYIRNTNQSPRYSKPALYESRWQAEVRLRTSLPGCSSEIPLILQLEDGFWRIVAIPYT
jgi:hypothetical protein